MSNPITAADRFLDYKARIDAALARLQDASDNMFGTSPDSVTWGNVADITALVSALESAADRATGEGEYAA